MVFSGQTTVVRSVLYLQRSTLTHQLVDVHDASEFFKHELHVVDRLSLGKLIACPRWNSEIPANSFIASLIAVQTYRPNSSIKDIPSLNFNLLSAVILGLPISYQVQPGDRSPTEVSEDHVQDWTYGSDDSDADDQLHAADQDQEKSDGGNSGDQIGTDNDDDDMYTDPS